MDRSKSPSLFVRVLIQCLIGFVWFYVSGLLASKVGATFNDRVGYRSGPFGATLVIQLSSLLLAGLLFKGMHGYKLAILGLNSLIQLILLPYLLNSASWDSDVAWPDHLSPVPIQTALVVLTIAQIALVTIALVMSKNNSGIRTPERIL